MRRHKRFELLAIIFSSFILVFIINLLQQRIFLLQEKINELEQKLAFFEKREIKNEEELFLIFICELMTKIFNTISVVLEYFVLLIPVSYKNYI